MIAVPFLAGNSDKKQRLKLFSYHFSLVLAAQVIGSSGGGYLADMLQSAGWSKIQSLQAVLFTGGAASVLAFVPLLLVRQKPAVQKDVSAAPRGLPCPIRFHLQRGRTGAPSPNLRWPS